MWEREKDEGTSADAGVSATKEGEIGGVAACAKEKKGGTQGFSVMTGRKRGEEGEADLP